MPSLVTPTAILRCALIGGIYLMLAGCGEILEEGSASTLSEVVVGGSCETTGSSLFSEDLAGYCRTIPPTMGALEVR